MFVHTIPDDNSCLFHAFAFSVNPSSPTSPSELRNVVSKGVLGEYSETLMMIGENPKTYSEKILKPNVWGGEIEMMILCNHFNVNCWAIDVETGFIHKYYTKTGMNPTKAIALLYSGIHYDSIASMNTSMVISQDAKQAFSQYKQLDQRAQSIKYASITTTFTENPETITNLKRIAQVYKENKKFVNTNKFTLKCNICNAKCIGQEGAQAHAKETTHTAFSEY